jgi:uncharacterized protein YndB with AHSA1/START domain
LIEFEETVEIATGVERVWRALTLPDEVTQWDTGIVEPIDAPADYPQPGQHVRWRYRLGPIPLTLHDRPSEVAPNATLRSSIDLGPFAFDEIYLLDSSRPEMTRLTARLTVSSAAPVVGSLLERVAGAPLARSTVRTSLEAIKRHCESTP